MTFLPRLFNINNRTIVVAGDGTRRYTFTIYALRTDQIPPFNGLARQFMKTYVEPNVIGRATFTALYRN